MVNIIVYSSLNFNKKAPTKLIVSACFSTVGVDGFEPPTLCL